MKIDPYYGGLVWTKHAIERMQQRGLTQQQVFDVIMHPGTSKWGSTDRSIKYQKVVGNQLVEAIIKKESGNKTIVLTCWSKPAYLYKESIPLWEKTIRWLWGKIFPQKNSAHKR